MLLYIMFIIYIYYALFIFLNLCLVHLIVFSRAACDRSEPRLGVQCVQCVLKIPLVLLSVIDIVCHVVDKVGLRCADVSLTRSLKKKEPMT